MNALFGQGGENCKFRNVFFPLAHFRTMLFYADDAGYSVTIAHAKQLSMVNY